jgi:hypothetical protein
MTTESAAKDLIPVADPRRPRLWAMNEDAAHAYTELQGPGKSDTHE